MELIKGVLESPTRLKSQIIYNMDAAENANIDMNDGVLVNKYLELSEAGIIPKRGKGYNHYVNPMTSEQWYEEFDRPLNEKELADVQAEKIDLILQMQMAAQNII